MQQVSYVQVFSFSLHGLVARGVTERRIEQSEATRSEHRVASLKQKSFFELGVMAMRQWRDLGN